MFASQNYRETRPFQPERQPHSNDETSSNSQGAAVNFKIDFSPNPSQHSTAALFEDYSTLPESQFGTYNEVDRFLVPRTSQDSSLDILDLDDEPQRSLVDGIARFGVETNLDLNQPPPELMPSTADGWMLGQLTPKSTSRLSSHHRESSLSSLGSAGPASPYTQTTSNPPHITVVDSTSDSYHDLNGHDHGYYQLSKPLHDPYYTGYHELGQSRDTPLALQSTTATPKQKLDRGLLVAPDFAFGSGASHPSVSVASSAASDSPATPSLDMPGEERRRRAAFNTVPKLDRSMTDAYNDELYSPSFNSMSAPSPTGRLAPSPTNAVFVQRLNAANSQHLNAGHSPVSTQSRDRSPFRNGSPLAPAPGHDFHATGVGRFRSAQQMREQTKMEQDAQAFRHQIARAPRTDTPKTISPKDAILEFQEPEGGANYPLFPPQESMPFDINVSQAPMAFDTPATTASLGQTTHAYSFMPTHLQSTLPVLQQYPFTPQHRSSEAPQSSGLVTRLGPSDTASHDSSTGSMLQPKAPGAGTDGGTYTCTYHGCTLRFETPALLQKHKREGHRQAHGLNTNRRPETGITNLLNSQAGPHRCDRINPSTGKPCNTIFSRPYDLTRHEDTIHNARKQKVRCQLCTEEKTFSRADALTRHFRVCHPDIEVPGKHRRRAATAK